MLLVKLRLSINVNTKPKPWYKHVHTLSLLLLCSLYSSTAYLLVFQMCSVSSSTLLCLSACSSRKSKKYLTAGGTTELEHKTLRKKSSTNCCSVPWKTNTEYIHTSSHKLIIKAIKLQCMFIYVCYL